MALTMKTTVTQGTQSVANNTTKITVKTTVTSTNGSYNHNSPSGTYKIYKNSTSGAVLASGTFSSSFDANTTTSVLSKSFTLTHDADGTLDIVVVVSFVTGISAGTLTNTVSKSLTDIPRKSTVTAGSCNIGEPATISIKRNSSSFKHTLQYGYGSSPSAFTNIVSSFSSDSYKWTVPEAAYAQCVSAKYVYITIRCYTYSGSTNLGYNDYTFKAYADEDECKPTVVVTAGVPESDHSYSLTGDSTRVVKGISSLLFTAQSTVKNKSTLKTVTVENGSQKQTGTAATFTKQFDRATSATVNATVTDSRGFIGSGSKSLTLVDYTPVSLSVSMGWETPTGGVMVIKLSGNYSDIDFGAVKNSLTLQYKYTTKDGYNGTATDVLTQTAYQTINTSSADVSFSLKNGKYSLEFKVEGLDYKSAYAFRFRVVDKVYDGNDGYTRKTATQTISAALPVFDWSENNFNFNVPVNFSAGVTTEDVEFSILNNIGSSTGTAVVKYFPHMDLVLVRLRIDLTQSLSAKTDYDVVQLSKMPPLLTVLNAYVLPESNGFYSVRMYNTGVIKFCPSVDIASGSYIYISGTFYVPRT